MNVAPPSNRWQLTPRPQSPKPLVPRGKQNLLAQSGAGKLSRFGVNVNLRTVPEAAPPEKWGPGRGRPPLTNAEKIFQKNLISSGGGLTPLERLRGGDVSGAKYLRGQYVPSAKSVIGTPPVPGRQGMLPEGSVKGGRWPQGVHEKIPGKWSTPTAPAAWRPGSLTPEQLRAQKLWGANLATRPGIPTTKMISPPMGNAWGGVLGGETPSGRVVLQNRAPFPFGGERVQFPGKPPTGPTLTPKVPPFTPYQEALRGGDQVKAVKELTAQYKTPTGAPKAPVYPEFRPRGKGPTPPPTQTSRFFGPEGPRRAPDHLKMSKFAMFMNTPTMRVLGHMGTALSYYAVYDLFKGTKRIMDRESEREGYGERDVFGPDGTPLWVDAVAEHSLKTYLGYSDTDYKPVRRVENLKDFLFSKEIAGYERAKTGWLGNEKSIQDLRRRWAQHHMMDVFDIDRDGKLSERERLAAAEYYPEVQLPTDPKARLAAAEATMKIRKRGEDPDEWKDLPFANMDKYGRPKKEVSEFGKMLMGPVEKAAHENQVLAEMRPMERFMYEKNKKESARLQGLSDFEKADAAMQADLMADATAINERQKKEQDRLKGLSDFERQDADMQEYLRGEAIGINVRQRRSQMERDIAASKYPAPIYDIEDKVKKGLGQKPHLDEGIIRIEDYALPKLQSHEGEGGSARWAQRRR